MRRINSYEEYRNLVKDFKKASTYTNLFLLKEQIQEMVRTKKLFYMIQEGNLFLFKKESGCYRMFYYITNDKARKRLLLSDPVVAEYIYKDEQNFYKMNEIQFLLRIGFVLGRRSCRMVLKSSEFAHKGVQDKKSNIVVSYVLKEDANKIFEMFWEVFDPLYAYLPRMDDLLKMIEKKEIMAAKDGEEIVGFLHFEMLRGGMHLWHLAVDKKYRRMGVGSLLLDRYHSDFYKSANIFYVWTDQANEAARNLYQQMGYCMDDRFADEYLLQEE